MNKRLLGLLAGAALLAACGSDNNNAVTASSVCTKVDSTFSGLPAKLQACPTTAGSLTSISVPSGQACATAAAQCNSSDLTKVNTFLDCANGLPACTSTTEQAWNTSFLACYSTLLQSGLSTSCSGIVSPAP